MGKQPPTTANGSSVRPPILAAVLQAIGFIDLAVTPVGALIVLALRLHHQLPLDGSFIALLLGGLIIGVTFGGLLVGLAAALRYVHDIARREVDAVRPHGYYGEPAVLSETQVLAADRPAAAGPSEMARIAALLTDLRDLQLMSPEEREAAVERLRLRAERRAADEVIDAINSRQLGRARVLLRYAEAAYGKTATVQRLQAKIDEASQRNEPLDFAQTRRHVADAVSENRWIDAERYAHAIYLDHPGSGRCRQLWDDTRRARLYAHIQRCAEDHHWGEALAAAEELIERFPDCREARALRRQMETLRKNAEIMQRKQYEQRFKEYLTGEHYADALRIARHVVEQYPQSPQAEALRGQIPLLEKRVAGERGGPTPPAEPRP